MEKKQWFALYTRSRAEKKVSELLQEKQIESYLPLVKTLRQWSDRKKMVLFPLIPSYIFVRINKKNYREVLTINGAVAFIKFEKELIPIPDSQMNAMKMMVEKEMDVQATAEHIVKGDEVRITSGALQGTKGEVLEISGKQRFILRVDIGYTLILNLQGVELIKV